MHVIRYLLGHWQFCAVCLYELHMKALASAALGLLWGSIMIMLCEIMFWLHYGYVVAASMTAASARGEAMLWPLCEPGENKCVCNSYSSSCLLPAS